MFRTTVDPVALELRALGFDADGARRLSQGGTLLDIRAGATLCRTGQAGSEAFLLLAGRGVVLLGDGTVEVGPGDVVGELAVLDARRLRNATVVAATDLRVLVFDPRAFRALAADARLHDRLAPRRAA